MKTMPITKPAFTISSVFSICSMLLVSTISHAAPVAISSSTLDRGDDTKTRFGLGFTSSIAQRPFVGVDSQDSSLIYISLRYKDFYIEGLDAGYHLWKDKNLSLDLLATPRFYEVEAGFAKNGELDGIDKTSPTYFAGLSSQYRTKPLIYTLQLLTDIKESDGTEILLTASKTFKPGNAITLAPAIGITYQDKKLVDHFYGVQSNEVISGRPAYGGHASINYHVSLTSSWNATKHIQLLGQLKYEQLGSGISDSPIVDDDSIATIAIGLVYRF